MKFEANLEIMAIGGNCYYACVDMFISLRPLRKYFRKDW